MQKRNFTLSPLLQRSLRGEDVADASCARPLTGIIPRIHPLRGGHKMISILLLPIMCQSNPSNILWNRRCCHAGKRQRGSPRFRSLPFFPKPPREVISSLYLLDTKTTWKRCIVFPAIRFVFVDPLVVTIEAANEVGGISFFCDW